MSLFKPMLATDAVLDKLRFPLLASAKLGKITGSVRYAHYNADTFATDADKFWLQLDWML